MGPKPQSQQDHTWAPPTTVSIIHLDASQALFYAWHLSYYCLEEIKSPVAGFSLISQDYYLKLLVLIMSCTKYANKYFFIHFPFSLNFPNSNYLATNLDQTTLYIKVSLKCDIYPKNYLRELA